MAQPLVFYPDDPIHGSEANRIMAYVTALEQGDIKTVTSAVTALQTQVKALQQQIILQQAQLAVPPLMARIAHLTLSGVASSTTTIPSGYSTLLLKGGGQVSNAAAQNLLFQLNSVSTATYYESNDDVVQGTDLSQGNAAQTSGILGVVGHNSDTNGSAITCWFHNINQSTVCTNWLWQDFRADSGANTALHRRAGGGVWANLAAVTSITLFPSSAANFLNFTLDIIGIQ
jgi:hypothetical protein